MWREWPFAMDRGGFIGPMDGCANGLLETIQWLPTISANWEGYFEGLGLYISFREFFPQQRIEDLNYLSKKWKNGKFNFQLVNI